ncbi:MAG: STAS domain-containing protein [Thermohalobaculum sp.]|nr:STAS domain-containing protein [Thermohalobaculum sp.]
MEIREERRGTSLVMTLAETRLDHVIATDFREHVLRRAAAEGAVEVVIDLATVQFMDSSGLGALVGIRKRLGWGTRIVLAGLRSPVHRVFQLARMTEVFTFHTSAEAAAGIAGMATYRAPGAQST